MASTCTYRFVGPDGKEVTVSGKAEMKAFLVRNGQKFFPLNDNLQNDVKVVKAAEGEAQKAEGVSPVDAQGDKFNYDDVSQNHGNINEQRGAVGLPGDEALGGVPAGEDRGPEGGRDVRVSGEAGRRAGSEGNSGSRSARSGGGRGRGDGAARVHPAEARAEDAVTPAEAPASIPAANFRITEDVRLGQGGEIQKYNDNLQAIQVLKTLEAERRRATPDEQRTLARYVGWGGLPNAFRNRDTGEVKSGWGPRVEALEALLTKDELAAARRSTLDAHYTSQPVVQAMWKAAYRLGFRGGMALEPSSGVGNFLGLVPEELSGKTRFIGIEYDSITARIAKALYPQDAVLHGGFQDVALQPNSFDLAIGNPPFGKQSLYFPYSDHLNGLSIHNQFFVGSMDAVRPGGLQVMVVSRYLMDAKDSQARRMLAKQSELIGAIRLPDTAFQENARTEVVTDIIFLKKRDAAGQAYMEEALSDPKMRAEWPAWIETQEVKDPLGGDPITVNRYFADNPSMMLGTLERSGSMKFGGDVTLRANEGEDIAEALESAISRLPELPAKQHDAVAESLRQYGAMRDALEMSLTGEEDGDIKFDDNGNLVQVVSRESAGSADMLSRRILNADSPWSPQLSMDSEGRWFRVTPKVDESGAKVKSGRFLVYDRETFASDKDVPESLRLGKSRFERLKGLAELRDLLKKQLTLEAADEAADVLGENRRALSDAYHAYVKANGFINNGTNQGLLANMPDGPLVSALELKYDPGVDAKRARRTGEKIRKESAQAAPILSQRVVVPYVPPNKASTGAEALTISLSETGRVDLARMAELLGKDEQGVIGELFDDAESPLIFRDPESGEWQTRDAYLSGQVVKKLAAAREAGMDKNAAALEAVQPPPLEAADITVRLGQSWVPADIYKAFVEKITGNRASVHFSKAMNQFDVRGTSSPAAKTEWGTERASPVDLIEAMMNSRAVAIYDYYKDENGKDKRTLNEEETQLANNKANEIANDFADWIMADPDRRSRLTDIYNQEFNNRVVRQYDGSHLNLPGKVPDAVIGLRRHQKNVVWRGIAERFLLIDHTVGAGKTYSAIARAMERRRMGLAKKPMIVVPNHLVEQFAADVYRLYPGARVLAAGKKDFEAKKRRRLFSKIATGDWDIVIVPHSSFGFIDISPEREAAFIQQEIDAVEAGIKEAEAEESGEGWRKPQSVKDGERLLERLTERMKRLKDAKRDKLLTFEQLGVDDITIDEAHMFKNLAYYTRLTKVLGLGSKEGSQRAWDLYSKVRFLSETPRGAVVFMTGTPISNSIVEMYTMMRYLAMGDLKDLGLEHFDAWHKQFAEAVTKFELNDANQLAERTRLARWSNMPELMKLYYSFTDAVSLDDIKRWYAEDNDGKRFPVPNVKGGRRQNIIVQPTPAQESILKGVVDEFMGLKDIKDPFERNKARLRLMDRARKVSLDARAVDPRIPTDEAGGKLEKVADEVARIHREWASDKGTQLIFLDRSVPKSKNDDKVLKQYDALQARRDQALRDGDEDLFDAVQEELDKFNPTEIEAMREAQAGGWNAYVQIKRNLMARGIPENEIRFIQEANTDDQKQQIFDAVKAGEVRVLLGSTERMGAGTNVQDRLVGLHHVDVNWKPSDIEQREGRIVRQGNLLLEKYGPEFEVEVLAYATERTYDAKMWALNEAKGRFINGLRAYDGEREVEVDDSESENMAEMAAMASGDPRMLERVQLDAETKKLELARRSWNRRRFSLEDSIKRAERDIEALPAKIEAARLDQKRVNDAIDEAEAEHAKRSIDIEGEEFDTAFKAMQEAHRIIEEQKGGESRAKFTLMINGRPLTSVNAVDSAIRTAFGDAEAFPLETQDGKRHLRRADAAEEIALQIQGMLKSGPEEGEIGRYYGLPLRAYVDQSSAQVTLFVRGESIREAVDVDSKDGKVAAANVQGAIATLGREIRYAVNVDSMERRLSDARESLPAMREQYGKPFAQAEEYEAKKARLEALTAELAREGKADSSVPAAGSIRSGEGDESAPISRREAEEVVASFRARFPSSPDTSIVERFEDLPAEVQQDAENQGGDRNNVHGVFHNGVMYFVRENHKSREALETTIAHELIGHFGLRNLLGQDFIQETNKLFMQLGGIDGLRRIAAKEKFTKEFDDYARSLVMAYRVDPDHFPEEIVKLILTEEVFAHIAQERPTIFSRLKAIVGRLREWLRSLGFFKGQDLNDYDVAAILSRVRSKLSKPSSGAGFERNVTVFGKDDRQAPMAKISEPAEDYPIQRVPLLERAGVAGYAGTTGSRPAEIRSALVERFGEEGIAKLERDGLLRIVPNMEAVPEEGRIDGAEAVYDPNNGVAYLIADRLSAGTAAQALLHELGEHHGLEGFIGTPSWRLLKARVASMAQRPGSFTAGAWEGVKAAYDEFDGLTDAELARNDRFIHEVLAKIGESGSERAGSLWRDLLAAIKRGLLRLGFTFQINEDDVRDLVDGSLRRLMRSGDGPGPKGGVQAPKSEAAAPMGSIRENIADFVRTPAAQGDIKNRISDLFRSGRTFNALHRSIGTQYHKAKVDPQHFGRVFNLAQQYIDDVSRTANEAADVAPDLLPKMERMRDAFAQFANVRADERDSRALADPIFSGTMEDRVWSDDELRSRFSLDERQIGLYRQFRAAVDRSLDELALSEMARTAKMSKLEVAPREMGLRQALDFYMEQIGPEAERLEAEMADLKERQAFERNQLEEAAENGDSGADGRQKYARLLSAMKARHAGELDALKAQIENVAEMLKATEGKVAQIEMLKAQGYAPLMRFGQYTVDVFLAGEDGRPLRDASGEEIRHFFGMFESESEANAAARALQEEYPAATVKQGILSQESFRLFKGVTPETVEVFSRLMGEEQSEVFQKYLKQAVSNRSALKRLIQRKGIAGFEKDPVRVLATFLTSNARATSANYHFGDMLRAASDIPKDKGDVKDEAVKLIDYVQNPRDEAPALRGLLFMHFLGGSVASAMVNMTQTFTMTYPYLAQFGGNVVGNIKEAMAVAGRRLFNKNADVPEELKAALQRAEDEGVVSPHEIHMLQGESMRTGWFQNNRYMRAFGKVWGSFFSLAEQFNRDVAFISAYRSAMERNLGDEEAYAFAKGAVQETQGVYSRANRPNWARGAVGATLFTFKQFSISYMEFLRRLPPRERAIALGVLWVFAGLSGMPFSDDLDDLIDTIAHMLGFAWDNKAGRRAFLANVFGKDVSEFIQNGVSAGLPLDISGRMGLANLIPATGLLDPAKDKAKELAEVAGPAGGAIQSYMKAADRIQNGVSGAQDVVDVAMMLAPVAVTNAYKGMQMLQDGYATDSRGRRTVDTDAWDALYKGMGFNPSVVAESSRAREEIFNASTMLRDMKSRISERWALGIAHGQPEQVAQAREILDEWNRNNPETPIRVNMAGILRRAKEARATSAERAVKATPKEIRQTANQLLSGTD